MNKTDLLFQMMEQPHAYTDQQWQEILADEECRELYTLMILKRRLTMKPSMLSGSDYQLLPVVAGFVWQQCL